MNWFDELCRQRHEVGLREYRGGDAAAPFRGDPYACAIEEVADLANYLREAARAEGFAEDPNDWPAPWLHRWNVTRESAEWLRRRALERAARQSGGIAWDDGNLDATV